MVETERDDIHREPTPADIAEMRSNLSILRKEMDKYEELLDEYEQSDYDIEVLEEIMEFIDGTEILHRI